MLDHDKSKEELIAELIALRQRLKDMEESSCSVDNIEYKRSKEDADFYLTILDEAPALIWRAAKDAKCDWFNATWLAFTGRQLSQEIGDGWAEGVHPEDFDRCLAIYLEAFHARKFFQMEYRLRRHDGEYRWILDIGCPFKDAHGEFAGYIGYVYDITDRKMNEQFRLEVERIVRHDIKAPLASLHVLAKTVFEDGIDEDIRLLVPGILRAVQHVINLVDSTEKIALLELGKYRPQSKWFSINNIIHDAEACLSSMAEMKKINIETNFDDSARVSCCCLGEESLVQDMITNILKNALEASPSNKTVTITCICSDEDLHILVHNHGAIPESIRNNFFDKYVTSGKPLGTGLGTYSAKLIAEAHGGQISFSTSEEDGTTVLISLPIPEDSAMRPGAL
ncbi:MAG: PAS domain S-box [Solidesulfovibrio magneticus str. Maddingley MBC34]|uniref:histidine kinase n=1 Tax=Solidesulfovibrio magneticus str. Maddingley MBC34 TaxID=1206767 RepID=K6FKX2_9BACT|nr:MAG: PAS domain S-box [Solidesulfovibrio magneticus str. Maddingley MBC34]